MTCPHDEADGKRDGAISFDFDPRHRIRLTTFRGVIDDQLLVQAYRRLVSEPDFDAFADVLIDLRDVGELRISSGGLRQLVEILGAIERPGAAIEVAIVAPTNAVFGMARMYQILRSSRSGEETKVFRSLDEALGWLRGER
jgi:hypothetical protein